MLEQGSGTGSVFKLRLWHNILVGYRPAWNEAVITDPHTFQSGGDLSGQPATDPSLDRPLATAVAEVLPRHDFDAVRWSGDAVRSMLEAVGLSGILLKARDTASHTLAWAIWLLGEHSRWQDPAALPRVVDEVLRLHPPLWLGTRVVSRDVELAGVPVKRKAVVGYSPYLTHRDPALWDAPAEFRPERFDTRPPPWSYLPFGGGGDRIGLGEQLTRRLLMTALVALCQRGLTVMRGDEARPRTNAGLRPAGPLWVIPGLRGNTLFRRSVG